MAESCGTPLNIILLLKYAFLTWAALFAESLPAAVANLVPCQVHDLRHGAGSLTGLRPCAGHLQAHTGKLHGWTHNWCLWPQDLSSGCCAGNMLAGDCVCTQSPCCLSSPDDPQGQSTRSHRECGTQAARNAERGSGSILVSNAETLRGQSHAANVSSIIVAAQTL